MRPLSFLCLLWAAFAGSSANSTFAAIDARVAGPDGQPLRATVRVLEHAEDPDSTARTYETDELGRFARDGETAGTVWIRIQAPGLRPVVLKDPDLTAPLIVRLDGGTTLSGRVVDLWSGDGIDDASVWVCDRDAARFGFGACAEHTVEADGSFQLGGVPDGAVRLGAASPNHAFASVELPARRDDGFHVLQLATGAPLNGRVVDDRGHPVEGARIGRDDHPVPFTDATEIVFDPPLITDEKGEFRHPGLETRDRAVYRGLAGGWYGLPSGWVSPVKGATQVLELTLERPAALQFGLRAPGGDLVRPRIRLVHHALGAVGGPSAETGADGRYRLEDLPTRPLPLKLTIDGYQPIDLGEVDLGPGRTLDLGDLDALPGVELAGTVVDSDGIPIESGWVELSYDQPTRFGLRKYTEEGAFRFAGLPSDVEIGVTAGADGFDTLEETLTLDGDTRRPFTLTPVATLRGRVLKPDGEPAARFFVRVTNQDVDDPNHADEEFLDSGGRFHVWPIEPAGSYTIEIRAAGYRRLRLPDVVIGARRSVDVGDLHLDLGHTVEGIASRPDGSPAEGSRIWITSRSGVRLKESTRRVADPFALAGRDGRYTLTGLSPGSYVAFAQHPDFAPWSMELQLVEDVTTETLNVEFSLGGAVHGTTRDRSGSPVAGVHVGVECPGLATDRTTSTDAQGYYRVERLPDEQCRIGAFRDEGDPFGSPRVVVVVAGRESRADFDLSRSIEVSGTVRVGGRVASRGFVTFQVSGGNRGSSSATAVVEPGSGRYITELSEPGEYRVSVESGAASHSVKVLIPDDRAVERDFDIPVNWLKGRVVDTEGDPVGGAQISGSNIDVDSLEGISGFAVSNPEGGFEMKYLEPGNYRLTAGKKGYRPRRTEPIPVRGDTRIENLELVLELSTSRIRGRLLDPRGAAISDGYVIAAPTGTYRIDAAVFATVNPDGSFVLDTPGDGPLDLTGLSIGWAPGRLTGVVPAEGEEITLRLEIGGRIAVTVLDRKGIPQEGVTLEVRAEPPWLGSDAVSTFGPQTVSGPEGIAVARDLAQGTYRVTAPGGASALVTVTDGPTTELRLRAE